MFTVRIRSSFAIGLTNGPESGSGSDRDLSIEVEPGTPVESLLEKLPSLGPADSYDDMMLHVFVNGKLRGFDYVLKEGDVIDLHIPVSGG